MNLPDISVRRPVATITILLIIIVIGVASLIQTPLDLLPDIKPPYLAVITIFPGSSPQENLQMVTEPIEGAVSPINGVKNILSLSQEHVSMVALEFNWGVDLKQKREEIGTRLDLLTLPEGVQRPIILEFDPTLLPMMQVNVSSRLDAVELTEWLEDTARPRLETIPGVASIRVEGGAKRDLFIRLFPGRIQEKAVSYTHLDVYKRQAVDPVVLKEGIYWVGAVDWDMQYFHGPVYSTHRGTTYNSYLIIDEKITLVDTVYRCV